MGTVLVTGASGFIGGHLVEALLQRGHQVRCLVRRTSKTELLRGLNVDLVQGDLYDLDALRDAMADVAVVYHLAAMTSALRTAELYRANAEGTGRVAEACAALSPPPVLVVVSSVAAAGPVPRGALRREQERPAPVSHYGRSKRAGELAAERYADCVPLTVVRPGIVFGPRNQELLPAFQAIERFGVHVVPTFSPPRLSILHIHDLVPAIVAAADHGERVAPNRQPPENYGQGYYFACSDEYPDYRQLGRLMADGLGKRRVRLWSLAEPLPWIVAAANELAAHIRRRPDSLNIDKIREATVPSWACSSEKARTQLGLHTELPLRERLRETAQWYKSHGWL